MFIVTNNLSFIHSYSIEFIEYLIYRIRFSTNFLFILFVIIIIIIIFVVVDLLSFLVVQYYLVI
jgi:hypothetical protein